MKIRTEALVEDGGGLVANYGLTMQVGDNLRWNGNPTKPEDDTVFKDRRLWLGLAGEALSATQEGWLGSLGRVVGAGSLNSLVATETLRMRLIKPAAPAQIPPAAPQAAPQAQGQFAGYYGAPGAPNARPW